MRSKVYFLYNFVSPESFISLLFKSFHHWWHYKILVSCISGFWISLLRLFLKWQSREELKEHMENCRTTTTLLSSFWDQVFKTRHQMNGHQKQIHHEETANPQMNERKRRSLKIILCFSTQKQLERRIQANLNAVCTVGMICIIAKLAILFLNCRIFSNLAHLFICWFTYIFLYKSCS